MLIDHKQHVINELKKLNYFYHIDNDIDDPSIKEYSDDENDLIISWPGEWPSLISEKGLDILNKIKAIPYECNQTLLSIMIT